MPRAKLHHGNQPPQTPRTKHLHYDVHQYSFFVCVAQMKKAMGLSTNWTFTDG